ncbi:Rho termination factor N-terminal domain-containing protein [Butyrivibrio sp. INlla14]|uniref:Rho termination factor N-terminal domain-containing protein n=1 Tax=Butyrivibrio sp. INlla14 TaxID=1520808 RepID=UPI000876E1A0|nr:Rho termination factor N-terminal domain-containing protein [Butyrivibrio sp. INlla14]SCY03517.1 Rho termination factor, N-terminal domain [Butyrivibrio sp. INlla14]
MFILNKKSGVISEASNEDVINHCKKNSDEYAVADTAEELTGAAAPVENPAPADPEPEDPEKDSDDAAGDPVADPEDEEPEDTEETDYAAMSVAELRKVAKEKGIQGYANMNKETLIEVIKAHE